MSRLSYEQILNKLNCIQETCCTDEISYYNTFEDFPETGVEEHLYADKSTATVYIWDNLAYHTKDIPSGIGDNWGTQVVEHDSSLAGDGTLINPLSVVINIPDLQEVTDVGPTTTTLSNFNGGIRVTGATIGVTNTDFQSNVPASVQINHTGGDYGLAITRPTNDANGANLAFYKTRGPLASSITPIVDGDNIGVINFRAVSAGSNVVNVGQIFYKGIPLNTGGLFGIGTPPTNKVAGLLDITTINLSGVNKNIVRIWPNGEFTIIDDTVGAILPRVNGINFQTYGTGLFTGSIKIGVAAAADASAVLDLQSTTQGFLPTRMTGAQAEAIAAPAEGLMVYATDGSGITITSKGWWGYNGTTWEKLN